MKRAIIITALALAACGGSDSGDEATTSTTLASTTTSTADASTTTVAAVISAENYFAQHPDGRTECEHGWEGSTAQQMRIDSIDFNRVCREMFPDATAPTASAVGQEALSRESLVAVQRCLDHLTVPGTFVADILSGFDDEVDATISDCDEASLQVSVDRPGGSLLAVSLSFLNVSLTQARLDGVINREELDAVAFTADVQMSIDTIREETGL